jgi:hypothetical protein
MVLTIVPALEIKTRMFKFWTFITDVGPMGLVKGPFLCWEDQ